MQRGKSTSCCEHMIAASSSNNDDDNVSLDAKQEEAPASTHDAASSSVVYNVEVVSLHSGIKAPGSTRHIKRITFQCKFVLL